MGHHNETTTGRLYTLGIFVLTLLALIGMGPPASQAQMRYSGGFTPSRRDSDNDNSQTTAKSKAPAAPKRPRDYFPDSDFGYYSVSPDTGNGDSASVPSTRSFYGLPPSDLPWNQPGFKDYDEPLRLPRDTSLSKAKKYGLEASLLSPAARPEKPETALLIARLPETAVFWVEGKPTRSTGRIRYFRSPPLLPGRKYKYTIRVAWIEDGQWVSQNRTIPVQAGLIQAIYLQTAQPK